MQSMTDILGNVLVQNKADFVFIHHDKPLISKSDASQCFDLIKAAPVFILEADGELVALVTSAARGRIDLKALRDELGYTSLRPVDAETALLRAGCAPGRVPLVGHGLPVIFDEVLLRYDYVYGKTGDILCTLQIRPLDLMRVSAVVKRWPDPQGTPEGLLAQATFGAPADAGAAGNHEAEKTTA